MVSCYKEKQCACGDFLYVQVYKTFGKTGQRRSRFKVTSEVQEMLNAKHRRLRLEMLIHENFTSRDMAVHLTYADGNEPADAERAKKDIQNFLKKLKRRYTAKGKVLKYIWVCECGKKSGRIHFHVLLSEGVSRDEIESLWAFGYANTKRLHFNENGLAGLSTYITKQPLLFKSWSASRNLDKVQEVVKNSSFSQKALKDIVEQDNILSFCSRYEGYAVSDFEAISNSNNGGFYIYARLYKTSAFGNVFEQRRNGG